MEEFIICDLIGKGHFIGVSCFPLKNRDSWCPKGKPFSTRKAWVGPTHSAPMNRHLDQEFSKAGFAVQGEACRDSRREEGCPEYGPEGQRGPFSTDSHASLEGKV